jgi:hypothetical protein
VSQVSILISSFDGYSECWGPVAHGFTKYWPDCPYPVHLMTNFKDFPHPTIHVLKTGADRGWSGRMLFALERLQTTFIMYFQEDYWIMHPVDTPRVCQIVGLMQTHRLDYVRLVANPVPDHEFPADPGLGLIDTQRGAYRTSVQVSIWRREVLRNLLRPDETVWQFELNATERSRVYGDTFLAAKKQTSSGWPWEDFDNGGIRYLCTAINAGRWFRPAVAYARNEGLLVDFSRRPMETWWDDFKRSGQVGRMAGLVVSRVRDIARDPAELRALVGRSRIGHLWRAARERWQPRG